MSRIPVATIDTAPEASQPMLRSILDGPGAIGRILNLQGQLAQAPAVLAAYLGLRSAVGEHSTLDARTRFAIQLTVAAAHDSEYARAVNAMLLARAGASADQIAALQSGRAPDDERLAALLDVAREAATHAGRVEDATWSRAVAAGWSDEDLADAFASIALTVFVDFFVAYAGTELDLPSVPGLTTEARS